MININSMDRGSNIKKTIESANIIAIFGHEYIDGDCLWSMLWLGIMLENMNKNISYFTPYPVGQSLQFLTWREKIQTTFDYGTYDNIIFVDFNNYNRIKLFTQWQEEYFNKQNIIIIDHHHGNTPTSVPEENVLIDVTASSCCERIYEHTSKWRPNSITTQIANYLYLGLTTDTGNFMYESNSPRTMQNAIWLIQAGADKKNILDNIFYRNNPDMIQFSNTLIHRHQNQNDILRTYYDDTELEGKDMDKDQADFWFHLLRTIYGPKIYIRIRKSWNELRWSVRGNGQIDCATLCNELFNGWGHYNAAWFWIEREDSFEKGINTIIKKIQTYLKRKK
jgi:phosphoesterase RecJ-like protein